MIAQKILIAHERGGFADLCKSWLVEEGYEVELATNRGDALQIANAEAFDVALLSNSFPDSGGLQFLRSLRKKGWDTPVILIAEQSFLPVHLVSEAVRLNITEVIEKPEEADELLVTLQAAAPQRPSGDVRGDLREFGLPSLISILCNEGRRALLRIWHNGRDADIYFDKGEIFHAALGDREGEDAVFEALTWNQGRFAMFSGRSAPQRTIHTSWTGLVLEGLRRVDEEAFDQEQLPIEEPSEPLSGPTFEQAPPQGSARRPTFEIDDDTQTRIDDRLTRLFRELRPRCVLLANRSGRLVHLRGDIERSRALSLAALVAGSFSATSEIAEIVARDGEHARFQQSLQEGVDFDLYSAQAGENWVLAVTFEPERTALGLARQLTLRAAADLSELASRLSQRSEEEEATEMHDMMDDLFRQEVGDALEDLFN